MLEPLHGLTLDSTNEEIKDKYDSWATKYDDDVTTLNYSAPTNAVKTLVRLAGQYGISKDSKIIDIGAGTGLIGELLKKDGYKNIDAVDLSPGMLEVARSKNCYSKLICGGIGNDSISIPDAEYDALFCIGCIIIGGINPKGITEMLNMVKPGGLYIVSVRLHVNQEEYGCRDEIDALVAQQKMSVVFKEKVDNLAGISEEDHARYCYLYCFVKN